jgi:predicted DNA-binding transcriptional regulator YafY
MRADRLISLLMLLQAEGRMTTEALAGSLEVSRRTVLRDIEALCSAGVPVVTESGHGGGVSLVDDYRTSLTGLTAGEVRALFVDGGPQQMKELGMRDAMLSSKRKLTASLSREQRAIARAVQQRILIDPSRWWSSEQPADIWTAIHTAVMEDHMLRITYQDFHGAASEREIAPYSLVSKTGAWYVVGRDGTQFKTFRVERIMQATLLDARFDRAPDFDIEQHWATAMGSFRETFTRYAFQIEVHPDRLGYLRWLAHGRHEVEAPCPDGWLKVRVAVDNADMALTLLFSLHQGVRAIQPASLAADLRSACERIAHST